MSDALAFGKHKGVPIDEVPASYLEWLVKQDGTRPDTRAMCAASLARRGGPRPPLSDAEALPANTIACPHCAQTIFLTVSEVPF
jgi:hypothetical protein